MSPPIPDAPHSQKPVVRADLAGGRRQDMGTVRYIGSKARVVDEILDIIGPPGPEDGFFVDAFAGTGVVGSAAADRGWAVRINDVLSSSVAISVARLVSAADVPFSVFGGYGDAIKMLDSAPAEDGFFAREYSSAGPRSRMYFTAENARRIDGIRSRLNEWTETGQINADERALLVADLIGATNRIANIAGTYGCFLTHWTTGATRAFELNGRELRPERVRHEAFSRDVIDVPMAPDDVAYFDPPYTKRQYAAYYHINETLACGDEPVVLGKTGLRPWRDKASDYCYKRRALDALHMLIASTEARRVFLSYSNEGHVDLDELLLRLTPLGHVELHEIATIGRYRPNQAASDAGDEVVEFLLELQKTRVDAPEELTTA
jgi:adenine-specific DNA-methyltransferase